VTSEVELIVARAPAVSEIEGALAGAYTARDGELVEVDRSYYDTFDALLRAGGHSLVWERGRLALELRDGRRAGAAEELPTRPAAPFFARDLPAGALRDALLAAVDVRALLPLARVRARTELVRILDGERKTVVRLEIETPELVTAGLPRALSTRIRLRGVRGYDRQLARVRRTLHDALALGDEAIPLVDEATIAAGGNPEGVASKVDVALEPGERSDLAAVAVLRRLLQIMDANLAGTIADTDPEFLHDYRVAIRRTRAVQRELRGVFPAAELARARTEFRWLQAVTGPARDLDVYVLGFDELRALLPEAMRGDLEPVHAVLRGRRLIARGEMVRELRSERAATLLDDWRALLAHLAERGDGDRPDCKRPIGELSSKRIRKVYGQMVAMGAAIDAASAPADYHELRKQGKELRYLLELFGLPLHEPEVVKPMIRALKALQDVLGRHQDREVQVAMLASLRDEVSARPGGPPALMAMGVLVERLDEDAAAARGEFARAFAAFASRRQRRLVRETFA
jgi:CHAD domain-containing protein